MNGTIGASFKKKDFSLTSAGSSYKIFDQSFNLPTSLAKYYANTGVFKKTKYLTVF